jgi:4-hydroxy-tetrahydrodipicolinate synthase
MLKNGFYTALGTPLTDDGKTIEAALKKHINDQIDAGAAGLLLMGSMGIEASVPHGEYARTVDIAIDAVGGRVPLFVGAMDNSVARVRERIDMIGKGRAIDGIVVTVPFYAVPREVDAISFFRAVADYSPYPIYIYDLPGVTQFRVSMNVIDAVISHPNIKGMKSANWELIKGIERKYPDAGFECLYSGLDSFDHANVLGIGKNLDGMFCCTPKNGMAMYECIANGDIVGARRHLDNILLLRDTMLANGLMMCFTHCMNLLGIEGNFHQDYTAPTADGAIEIMRETLERIGEI